MSFGKKLKKAIFGSEIQVPTRDKDGNDVSFDEVLRIYESGGTQVANSTGGTKAPEGNPNEYTHVDAQGHSTITDFEEMKEWANETREELSKQFDAGEVDVGYWLWTTEGEIATKGEDGNWHSSSGEIIPQSQIHLKPGA